VLLHLFPVSLQTCYLFSMIIFSAIRFRATHLFFGGPSPACIINHHWYHRDINAVTSPATWTIPSLERRSLGNFPASYFPIGSWPLCHPSGVIFHNFSFRYSLSAGPHFCLASIMLCAFTVLHPVLLFSIVGFLSASSCDLTRWDTFLNATITTLGILQWAQLSLLQLPLAPL
jgi:hypothetical protein